MSSNMTDPDRWYFSKEKLYDSPSRKCGIDEDKELSYRQQAANFIQDMGQRLQVTQLCINTAIVYMHRFYMFHSFSKFHRNAIAACALFLAAKVEEQPRKLEHVIKVAHWCLNIKPNKLNVQLDVKSPEYIRQANELVINENIMLQTLGFEIGIEHPHTSVVKCCQLVRATKDLAQTSYFMATNSLHLTTMCLQYKPTVVACFCIHMACKWANWEIPKSNEGKAWFFYVDETVTLEMLEKLTSEFLLIFDRCPTRLKRKIASGEGNLANDSNRLLLPLSSSSDKKQVQNEQDSKQRVFPKPNSDQLSNNKVNPQTSTSRSNTESNLSHNHLPNHLTSNGPTKDVKKEIFDRNFQSKNDNVNISKQYEKSKDNSAHYTAFRDKKESDNKSASQLSTKEYNKPNSLINKALVPPVKDNKDSKFSYNSSDINDLNNKNSITNVNQKPTKQQILIEKQRQSDERNKHRPKNQDYLWNDTNKTNINIPKVNSSVNNVSSANVVGQSFYENLINNPINYNNNSNSSNDNSLSKSPKLNWDSSMGNYEDFTDSRKDLNSDLKMEFSDNDSNQSNTGVNLNSLPFMSDTINNTADNRKPLKNSFMEIFKDEETPKSSSTDFNSSNVNLTDLRPQQPPKMLSPLRHDDIYSSSSKKPKIEPVQSSKNFNYKSGQSSFNEPKISSPNKGQFSSSISNTDRSMKNLAPALNVNNQQFLQHQSSSMHTNQINTAHHSQNQQTSSSSLSTLSTQNSVSSQSTFQGHTQQQLSASTHPMQPYSMSSYSNPSLNFNQNKNDLAPPNNQFFNNSLPQMASASIDSRTNLSNTFNQQMPHQVDKNAYQDMYAKPTTSKSKEKDRSEKHHKKHKSKDKHKSKHKDKSKDKDRSSKYSVDKEINNQIPIKLIIKKGGNEESSNGDEKPIEKLKIVIPKTKMSYTSPNDRKRRLSPKDGRERSSKIPK